MLEFSSREDYALMVADGPGFSGVDESSENATSFPESATSFEDMVMHHVAHIFGKWNAGLESARSPLGGTAQDRNAPVMRRERVVERVQTLTQIGRAYRSRLARRKSPRDEQVRNEVVFGVPKCGPA